jgi:hypothetical protein
MDINDFSDLLSQDDYWVRSSAITSVLKELPTWNGKRNNRYHRILFKAELNQILQAILTHADSCTFAYFCRGFNDRFKEEQRYQDLAIDCFSELLETSDISASRVGTAPRANVCGATVLAYCLDL